jgi:hypothetical protein
MAVSKWQGGAATSVLTTELNALANDAGVVSGTITSTRDQHGDLELVATFASAPTADRAVDVYAVRTVDGTDFEDASASRPPASGYLGSFAVNNVGTAQRLICAGVSLPVRDFKLLLVNKSGQAFTASGHTLKFYPYSAGIE